MKNKMRSFVLGALACGLLGAPGNAHAVEGNASVPRPQSRPQSWTFEGLRGKWDKNELYRGYTVATQVCLACHSFAYVSHRDMMRAGFTEAEVQAMASALGVTDIDRKLLTGLDEKTAQETYGKTPPDLSLMTRARQGGVDYVYAFLTGYDVPAAEVSRTLPSGLPGGLSFNRAFPGHVTAMADPFGNGAGAGVKYHDGTAATAPQMAHDVATFMQWSAQPEYVGRRHVGVYVLLYLAIFGVLAFFSKRVIWKDVEGR